MNPNRTRSRRQNNTDWSEIHRRLEQLGHSIEDLAEPDPQQQEQILRERTASLAKAASPRASVLHPAQSIEVLVFQAAGERYAFETAYVAQVCPMLPVTSVPGAPDFVVGIMSVQGDVVSVIDLRSLLDLPLSRLAEPVAIILLKGETMEFGIVAEEILGIERYTLASLERALPTLADTDRTYLTGVSPDRTAILDATLLLSDSRLVVDAG